MRYCLLSIPHSSRTLLCHPAFLSTRSERTSVSTPINHSNKKKAKLLAVQREKEKRRTRSTKEFISSSSPSSELNNHEKDHIPVMLGEVLDVFSSFNLRSFVDCTLGAAGHSSFVIQAHPEMESYVGMDVDLVAHVKARSCIDFLLLHSRPNLKEHTFVKNFKHVKSVISEVDSSPLSSGVDAILMDLGMSSMQVNNPRRGFSVVADGPLHMRMDPLASLKAEDILNSWPDAEVGRVLRDYGEERIWHLLQNKIVQARMCGGLHSTGDLVDLIRNVTHG